MKTLRWLANQWFQVVLLALPFAVAAAWWNKTPPLVVTHWNIHGRPNGWMPRAPGLLLLPVLNVAVCVLIAFLPRLDPRLRRNPDAHTARQRRLRQVYRYLMSGFFSTIALAVIAIAAGWHVNMGRLCCNGAFVLFAVLGNFFGSLEPNYLLGIRTPWTLEDPGTWRATHRCIGRWMVFGAVTLLGASLFVSDVMQVVLLLVFVMGIGLGSVAYSAWYFHRQQACVRQ